MNGHEKGYRALLEGASEHASDRVWGCENPQSYGRRLAQFLVSQGEYVLAVSPHLTGGYRQRSSARDKTDAHDALAVARAILQEGQPLPPVLIEGPAVVLQLLVEHHDNYKGEATRERNRLHAQLLALDPDYRQRGSLTESSTLQTWLERARPGAGIVGTRWQIVVALCQRLLELEAAMEQLKQEISDQVQALGGQPLLKIRGVGGYLAGKLIGETGNPALFVSEACWANYAGVAPIRCSSGKNQRQRLNRGGNRQLNSALHQIMLTQLRCEPPARQYYQRKQVEGKSPRALCANISESAPGEAWARRMLMG